MATKVEEPAKNDWDDEEDDWDDWGDAEDSAPTGNIEQEKSPKIATTKSNPDKQMGSETVSRTTSSDETPVAAATNQKPSAPSQKSSWGSLWGSVISTASDLTTTVSQGLNQVIGVPDPEELARINAAEAKQREAEAKTAEPQSADDASVSKDNSEATTPVFGLSLVSGVTTLGSKVLNTGLDTLEGIGKKTMNILQENDPLLKNKRKLLGLEAEKPNLSEVLKEAKTDAERLENTLKELKIEKTKQMLRFDILFENYCGLVHLEALEILSKESTIKLQSLMDAVSGKALEELQETVTEVKELMELEDFDSVESDGKYNGEQLCDQLKTAIEDVELQITFDDIASVWSQSLEWIASSAAEANEQDVFAKGLTALAETCALEMSKFHKIAELLLVQTHHSTANEVDSIVQLTRQFSLHLNGLTNQFAGLLNDMGGEEAKTKVSTLFGEMLVATQQIQKAFDLFAPILQIGAV